MTLYVLSYLHHYGSEIYWEEIFGVFDDEERANGEKVWLLNHQPYFDQHSLALYEDSFRIDTFKLNVEVNVPNLRQEFERKNKFLNPHPFVATPNKGKCSSCGRARTAIIHRRTE